MPHHRHGVVKYATRAAIILSLNLTDSNRFERDATDALVTVLTMPRGMPNPGEDGFVSRRAGELVDAHGHHYECASGTGTGTAAEVSALRLIVDDLAVATGFTARFWISSFATKGPRRARSPPAGWI